ncbi:MAG: alpha/beta hydrolase family esterase [Thermoleophilaceae bacterium]
MRPSALGIAAACLLACVLAAAAGVFAPPSAGVTGPCGRAATRGSSYVTLNVAGIARTALVHVPRNASGGHRLPVVLALHGSGGTGNFMASYSGLGALSDQAGFVGVFPSAMAPARHWNIGDDAPGAADDIQFIQALLDRVRRANCVDPNRVYATGVSNGGGMVAKLGCELNSRFAAIAPVAGGYSQLGRCRARRPTSVLEVHGTADAVVPYNGRGPDHDGSVPEYVAGWQQFDHCPAQPASKRFLASRAQLFVWQPCAKGATVAHLKLYGGAHAWPGANPPDRGLPIAVNAAQQVWTFFSTQRRAPAH